MPPKRPSRPLVWLLAIVEVLLALVELLFMFVGFVISPVVPADLWPLLIPPLIGFTLGMIRLRVGRSITWGRSTLLLAAVWTSILLLGAAAIYWGGGGSQYLQNLKYHRHGWQM